MIMTPVLSCDELRVYSGRIMSFDPSYWIMAGILDAVDSEFFWVRKTKGFIDAKDLMASAGM